MPLPTPFVGVIPPVCTPFTEDGELDIPSLERLLGFLMDNGVHGLFMLGSTSETATLTDHQREQVIEVAIKTVAGQVPVIAGVIDMGTNRQIEHARTAQRLGVDALVATGPYYIKPSQAEIIEHYRRLHAAVDLPILAYDIPGAVQIKLERPTIFTLARDKVIVGMKDSSGQDANFRGVILDTREIEGFSVFTGSELTADVALVMGASGIVPGLGNVDPAGFVRIFDAFNAGDLATATAEQNRVYQLFDGIRHTSRPEMGGTAGALGGFKTALQLRGIISTNVTGAPMTRLNAAETARLRDILVATGLL